MSDLATRHRAALVRGGLMVAILVLGPGCGSDEPPQAPEPLRFAGTASQGSIVLVPVDGIRDPSSSEVDDGVGAFLYLDGGVLPAGLLVGGKLESRGGEFSGYVEFRVDASCRPGAHELRLVAMAVGERQLGSGTMGVEHRLVPIVVSLDVKMSRGKGDPDAAFGRWSQVAAAGKTEPDAPVWFSTLEIAPGRWTEIPDGRAEGQEECLTVRWSDGGSLDLDHARRFFRQGDLSTYESLREGLIELPRGLEPSSRERFELEDDFFARLSYCDGEGRPSNEFRRLCRIDRPSEVLPVLLDALADPLVGRGPLAVHAVGQIGPAAARAAPVLRRFLDENPKSGEGRETLLDSVVEAAASALARIGG